MLPGQAPVRMSPESIAEQSMGFGVLSMPTTWLDWAIAHIEPIEDET